MFKTFAVTEFKHDIYSNNYNEQYYKLRLLVSEQSLHNPDTNDLILRYFASSHIFTFWQSKTPRCLKPKNLIEINERYAWDKILKVIKDKHNNEEDRHGSEIATKHKVNVEDKYEANEANLFVELLQKLTLKYTDNYIQTRAEKLWCAGKITTKEEYINFATNATYNLRISLEQYKIVINALSIPISKVSEQSISTRLYNMCNTFGKSKSTTNYLRTKLLDGFYIAPIESHINLGEDVPPEMYTIVRISMVVALMVFSDAIQDTVDGHAMSIDDRINDLYEEYKKNATCGFFEAADESHFYYSSKASIMEILRTSHHRIHAMVIGILGMFKAFGDQLLQTWETYGSNILNFQYIFSSSFFKTFITNLLRVTNLTTLLTVPLVYDSATKADGTLSCKPFVPSLQSLLVTSVSYTYYDKFLNTILLPFQDILNVAKVYEAVCLPGIFIGSLTVGLGVFLEKITTRKLGQSLESAIYLNHSYVSVKNMVLLKKISQINPIINSSYDPMTYANPTRFLDKFSWIKKDDIENSINDKLDPTTSYVEYKGGYCNRQEVINAIRQAKEIYTNINKTYVSEPVNTSANNDNSASNNNSQEEQRETCEQKRSEQLSLSEQVQNELRALQHQNKIKMHRITEQIIDPRHLSVENEIRALQIQNKIKTL
tara:strand:- start:196 stop:2169 length:1974 start_codon:yes stop_codon:yes gene_type:complete